MIDHVINTPNKRRQITFAVNEEFHQRVRILAAKQNISMNLLIVNALVDYFKKHATVSS